MAESAPPDSRWERLVAFVTVGGGRPFAAVMMALWLAVAFADPAALTRLRTLAFDLYQVLSPREPAGFPAKVVAIDEASLQAYGQWPWPRTVMARLIDKIAAADPAAIGFDVIFPEVDPYSPAQLAQVLPQLDAGLATRLANFPSNDVILADAFRRYGRVVLAKAGVFAEEADDLKSTFGAPPAVRQVGPPADHLLTDYAYVQRSIDVLERAASGWGSIVRPPDDDGVVRRLPAVVKIAGSLVPGLSLEMIRVLQGSPVTTLVSDARGYVGIDPGDFPIRIDRDGHLTLHHSRHIAQRFISAKTVLEAEGPIDELNRRMVIIGATAIGLHDLVVTPLEQRMPGVEIHVQALESLIDDSFLVRPDWVPWAELAATAAGGLLLLWLVPVLRPGAGFAPLIVIWAALATAGWGLFTTQHTLFDPTAPAIGTGVTFVAMLGMTLILAEQRRREIQAELEREQRAAQILQGQLDAAQDIQMSMLPDPKRAGLPATVDLDARLVPARTVGGDLYDFFMIDEHRLFFHIGDVTGKGVDAALFMALSKALCKSVVLRNDGAMDRIMAETNAEMARENISDMMLTMFAGILDLETGVIEFCNAGHEAPYRLAAGAEPVEIESEGGPPLCALDDFDYPLERTALAPGEMLVLYTDGVTDAVNPADELFGRVRLSELVAGMDPDAGAGANLKRLYDSVDVFVAGADAADDITVVVLRRMPDG
ncbi:MAG: CHASE2 domain-containing protein [Alphaproteobacteria bacterium]